MELYYALDRGKETCDQLPIKENYLEELFVKTFNKLLTNKENILDEIKTNRKSALLECVIDNSELNRTLKDIDNEIEKTNTNFKTHKTAKA